MTGIPVSNMATGVPFSINGGGFHDTFGMTADDVYISDADYLWITTCLPTVIRNPVRCQATGNVTVSGNNLTVTASNCSVTGAAASWSLLTERQYNDGWWPTLHSMMIGDFSFSDSHNQLEDALGLVSGIVLGMYWGTTGYYQTDHGDTELFGKSAAIDDWIMPDGIYGVHAVRIGPAQWWALVYILPLLFSTILLSVLLIQTRNIRSEE
jgi:hypothetical protein